MLQMNPFDKCIGLPVISMCAVAIVLVFVLLFSIVYVIPIGQYCVGGMSQQ